MARISIIGNVTVDPTIEANKIKFSVAENSYRQQQPITTYYEITVMGDHKMKSLQRSMKKGSKVVIQNAEFSVNVSQQGKIYQNVFIGDNASIEVVSGFKRKEEQQGGFQQQGDNFQQGGFHQQGDFQQGGFHPQSAPQQ